MEKKRKVYAPFSLTSEAGVAQTPVEGYIDVNQTIYPTVSTGTINENGTWTGVKSNDSEFINLQTDLAVGNGATIISNKVINMQNYDILMLAIKVSNAGNYVFELLLGGDVDDGYYNLKPVNTAMTLKSTLRTDSATNTFDSVLSDTENLNTGAVWFVFKINDLKGFNLKYKITNSSGGASNMETAIMRIL